MSLPKVAICFPSGDSVHADFALALASLCHLTAPFEATIINAKSSIVAMARNEGVRIAREKDADFILFLDSDMTFPRATLHRLLAHQKDIVGALYTKRVAPYPLLGASLQPDPNHDERGLVEMRHMPTGCLLIRMPVFDALTQPHFRFLHDETTGEIQGEDYVFCDRARGAGFRVWCDARLSREVGHIGQYIHRVPDDPALNDDPSLY
jgi:hypothetical protein